MQPAQEHPIWCAPAQRVHAHAEECFASESQAGQGQPWAWGPIGVTVRVDSARGAASVGACNVRRWVLVAKENAAMAVFRIMI